MAFFTTNYSQTNQSENKSESKGFTPVPEGTYECIIVNASLGQTPSGKEYIKVEAQIDPAHNQTAKNQHAFLQYWRRKATGQYDPNELNAMLQAVGVGNGVSIASVDQFLTLLKNKRVRLHLKVQTEEYQGKTYTRNRAYADDWMKSDVEQAAANEKANYESMNAPTEDPFAPDAKSANIDSSKQVTPEDVDDLPF